MSKFTEHSADVVVLQMQIKCIDPVIVSFSPNEMEIVLIGELIQWK